MRFDLFDKNDYDIITALRGPDYDGRAGDGAYVLKFMTSAVLRWHCGMRPGTSNGAFMVNWESVTLQWSRCPDKVKQQVLDRWNMDWHFRHHIKMGAKALSWRLSVENQARIKNGIPVTMEQEAAVIEVGRLYNSVLALLREFSPNKGSVNS